MLQRQIDRIFDDFTGGWRSPDLLSDTSFGLMPSIDVHEADSRVTVAAELPGVDEKDVEITVADQTVTISGEKRSAVDEKKGDQYRSERSYGKFSRTIALPFDIDPDKVEARFDKGVLTLTIPRPAGAMKMRKIPIKH